MRFTRRSSANRACYVAPLCLLLGLSLSAQETSKNGDRARAELRGVLLQARDAVVRLAAEDDSSLNGSISDRVKRLVEALLYVDDREDVRYLQRHLKKAYADEIRSALEPSATLQDFAPRVSKASRVKDDFEHDADLQTIVTQEIERGFVEDAVNAAQRMRLPGSRSRAFIDIALAQHRKGHESQADDAVTAAIHACFQPGTGLPLIYRSARPPTHSACRCAGGWISGGSATSLGGSGESRRGQNQTGFFRLVQPDPGRNQRRRPSVSISLDAEGGRR